MQRAGVYRDTLEHAGGRSSAGAGVSAGAPEYGESVIMEPPTINGELHMRTLCIAILSGFSTQLWAHPGHGLVTPHLHAADGYLLLGFAIALAGAIASWRLK